MVSLHIYIAGSCFVLLFCFYGRLPWCLSWHVFVLNDSVIQGSLHNHCSNTPDTSGVKLNIKKNYFVSCFVICGKPSKGKTKGILLGKVIFPSSYKNRNPCNSLLMVKMASGMDSGHMRPTTTNDDDDDDKRRRTTWRASS